jgi:hypothetical protein
MKHRSCVMSLLAATAGMAIILSGLVPAHAAEGVVTASERAATTSSAIDRHQAPTGIAATRYVRSLSHSLINSFALGS